MQLTKVELKRVLGVYIDSHLTWNEHIDILRRKLLQRIAFVREELVVLFGCKKKKALLRDTQSLVGLLNFACLVVTPGRPFLRSPLRCTIWKPNISQSSPEEDEPKIESKKLKRVKFC